MVLSLRKKENLKVRQPLAKILVPIIDTKQEEMVAAVQNLILSEVNVKQIEFVKDTAGIVAKKIKPNFKLLGKKLGPLMKEAGNVIAQLDNEQIRLLETNGSCDIKMSNGNYILLLEEVEILTEDIAGWLVASEKGWTVALDISLTEELKKEGYAREMVNKIQNQRKENNYEVTDRIIIKIQAHPVIKAAIDSFKEYICNETLANDIVVSEVLADGKRYELNDQEIFMEISKL